MTSRCQSAPTLLTHVYPVNFTQTIQNPREIIRPRPQKTLPPPMFVGSSIKAPVDTAKHVTLHTLWTYNPYLAGAVLNRVVAARNVSLITLKKKKKKRNFLVIILVVLLYAGYWCWKEQIRCIPEERNFRWTFLCFLLLLWLKRERRQCPW